MEKILLLAIMLFTLFSATAFAEPNCTAVISYGITNYSAPTVISKKVNTFDFYCTQQYEIINEGRCVTFQNKTICGPFKVITYANGCCSVEVAY